MITESEIEDILALAVNAPSGDNAQPWQFKIGESFVDILNKPGVDATLYNFRERGSFLALGALSENIVILAAALGYKATLDTFPKNDLYAARIKFESAAPSDHDLADAVPKRKTNRKPYDKRPLDKVDRDFIISHSGSFPATLRLVEAADVETLATTVNLNERLLFENRALHDFLFGMIRWTRASELAQGGLYIKTMEFPVPLQFLLKFVFRHFPIVSLLNGIGLSKAIPQQSAELYRSSSAFGAIIINDLREESFFTAGRMFERIWLSATTKGISLQPVAGIPYLRERIIEGAGQAFSAEHTQAIKNAYEKIARVFATTETQHIAMMFRLGYGAEPTAQSAKLPPEILR